MQSSLLPAKRHVTSEKPPQRQGSSQSSFGKYTQGFTYWGKNVVFTSPAFKWATSFIPMNLKHLQKESRAMMCSVGTAASRKAKADKPN